jgi:hypothetical protein
MDRPLPPITRARLWCRKILAPAGLLILIGIGLCGCGAKADFGEVNPVLVRDDIHNWVGRDLPKDGSTPVEALPLTDDERQLRDLAFPLLEAPYNRQRWDSAAREYGLLRPAPIVDRAAYFNHLSETADRSPAARYAQLIDDIRNDSTRLPEFFETAGRVFDMDRKRARSFVYVTDSAGDDVTKNLARDRIRENARIVAMVRASLSGRTASYRFAMARLAIVTPSPRVVETEQVLNNLQAQVAHYQHETAPTWSRAPSLAYSP